MRVLEQIYGFKDVETTDYKMWILEQAGDNDMFYTAKVFKDGAALIEVYTFGEYLKLETAYKWNGNEIEEVKLPLRD